MRLGGLGLRIGDFLRWAGETGSTLLNDLVAYWPLDEVSGTRYDAVGTNHLTDNNTVGVSLAGPSGTVADFVPGNSESLSVADPFYHQNFTLSIWFKQESNADYQFPITKDDTTNREWSVQLDPSNSALTFFCFTTGGAFKSVQGATTASLGNWHHLVAWLDSDLKPRFVFDGGEVKVADEALSDVLLNSTAPLVLGARNGAYFFDGKIGPTGVWSRILTAGERTAFFNSGVGKSYADLTTAEKVGLVSYWNLDEVSGQRNDSHGTNHLTDNNTVGSLPATYMSVSDASQGMSKTSVDIDFSTTGFTVAGWFYTDTGWPSVRYDTGAARVFLWSAGVYYVFSDNSTYQDVALQPPYPAWAHVVFWWDPADKKGHASVNGGAEVTTAALSAPLNHVASRLMVGGATDQSIGKYHGVGLWNRLLTADEKTTLRSSMLSYGDLTAGVKTGLVSWWDCGNTLDSVGTHNLTVTGAPTFTYPSAMHNGAASFVAGNSEYLNCDNTGGAGALALTTAATWSYWVKPDDITGDFAHVTRWDYATDGDWSFAGHNAVGYGFIATAPNDDGSGCQFNDNADILEIGTWAHMVWVYDGSGADNAGRMKLYVNNAARTLAFTGTVPTSMQNSATAMFAVGLFPGLNRFMSGQIDEVAIWNRVLTADERTALWNAGKGKYYDFSG